MDRFILSLFLIVLITQLSFSQTEIREDDVIACLHFHPYIARIDTNVVQGQIVGTSFTLLRKIYTDEKEEIQFTFVDGGINYVGSWYISDINFFNNLKDLVRCSLPHFSEVINWIDSVQSSTSLIFSDRFPIASRSFRQAGVSVELLLKKTKPQAVIRPYPAQLPTVP